MFRSLILLVVAAFFVSTLSSCILVDGHPGQFKPSKGKHGKHGKH